MDKAYSMTARGIGVALKAIAAKDEKNHKRIRIGGHQRSFYKIDTELLATWSEAHGRMSKEDVFRIVGAPPF